MTGDDTPDTAGATPDRDDPWSDEGVSGLPSSLSKRNSPNGI